MGGRDGRRVPPESSETRLVSSGGREDARGRQGLDGQCRENEKTPGEGKNGVRFLRGDAREARREVARCGEARRAGGSEIAHQISRRPPRGAAAVGRAQQLLCGARRPDRGLRRRWVGRSLRAVSSARTLLLEETCSFPRAGSGARNNIPRSD